jgi:hypothetical protein
LFVSFRIANAMIAYPQSHNLKQDVKQYAGSSARSARYGTYRLPVSAEW